MKRVVLALLVLAATAAFADDITFIFSNGGDIANLTSGGPGMFAGPADIVAVSDTVKGLEFPLTATVNASTGIASSITVTLTSYVAIFTSGGDVTVTEGGTSLLTGSPMFDNSHLSSNLSEDTGSFQGEFNVTSVNPTILAKFGLGPGFKPDGSFSLTFAESNLVGADLTAIIGGGSVTIETPTAPTPEAATLLYFGMAALTVACYRRKQGLRLL